MVILEILTNITIKIRKNFVITFLINEYYFVLNLIKMLMI